MAIKPEVWATDDVSFAKFGHASAGVARRYCGVLGKRANLERGCWPASTAGAANVWGVTARESASHIAQRLARRLSNRFPLTGPGGRDESELPGPGGGAEPREFPVPRSRSGRLYVGTPRTGTSTEDPPSRRICRCPRFRPGGGCQTRHVKQSLKTAAPARLGAGASGALQSA